MLSKSAWSASDRTKWGKQAVGPGQHRVLMALWDHAHGWREGDGDWFVWPAIGRIAARFGLTDDAVRRCLRELAARGWLRSDTSEGNRGWWLHVQPREDSPQLELFASVPGEPAAVDNLCTIDRAEPHNHRAGRDGSLDNHRVASSTGTFGTVSEPRAGEHDDDAARIWLAYEADRARMLGGTPRTGPPPLALRALIAEIGLPRVETYARRALELAADARARGRTCAATLELARADGREWHVLRVEAVERFPDPPRELALLPRPAPPPDPIVDGVSLSRFERESWDRGGEEAVRAQRAAELADQSSGVASIEGWLARHRMGGAR